MSTPLWQQGGGSGFSTSGGGFAPSGLPRSSSGYGPPPSYGPTSPETADSGATPGTYNLNPLDPIGTAGTVAAETGNFMDGLKAALFGANVADPEGHRGGLLGDVPLVSDVGRFASEATANAGAAVLGVGGNILDATGGLLEHIPSTSEDEVRRLFAELPDDSEAKQKAMEAIASSTGPVGPAVGHIMASALRQREEELSAAQPNLWTGLYTPPASLAETVNNVLGALGVAQRGTERLIAGAGKPGDAGMNRLQQIVAVAEGKAGFKGGLLGSAEMNPIEYITYTKFKSGEWTETEALDFLSSHGAGIAHDPALQMAGTMATDPLNVAALGASGLAAGGRLAVSAKTASEAGTMLRAPGTAATANIVGRLAETEGGLKAARILTSVYPEMQGTLIGRMSKVARTVVDPLHAMGLRLPGQEKNVDLLTELTVKTVIDGYGAPNQLVVIEKLAKVDRSLVQAFGDNLAVYAGNLAKRVVGNSHRNSILADGLGDTLATVSPDEVVAGLVTKRPRSIVVDILEETARNRIVEWTPDQLDNLSLRMAKAYGFLDEEEWSKVIADMSDDQRGLLHASTYGYYTNRLAEVRDEIAGAGGLGDKAHRLILLSKKTLTVQGAGGIIDRMKAGTVQEALQEIETAKGLYPELRYFTSEGAAPSEQVARFEDFLRRKQDSLPMQVVDDELAANPPMGELQDEMYGVYTLGFAPPDEFKWGIARTNAAGGKWEAIGPVWVDHVGLSEVGPGYTGARHLTMNFAGKPVIGAPVRMVAKAIDSMEAMGRVLKAQVSGAVIADAARLRGRSIAVGKYGFTVPEANEMMRGMEELTSTGIIANPRGLAAGNLWQSTKHLVPPRLAGQFDQRDLLSLMLRAYEGDVRFVGVTQKLTGRAKRVVGEATGVNFLGQIAENVYPTIKFRINAVFQTQERIEPIILNAQRGAAVILGRKPSAVDEATAGLFQRMLDHSLVRMGDIDQYEYSTHVLQGDRFIRAGDNGTGVIAKLKDVGGSLLDVQGAKRLNMLRTFRKGLGKEMKAIWEEFQPGVWDDMKLTASKKAGGLLNDDDFAINMIGENMLGSDVLVRRLERGLKAGGWKADFKAAIEPGRWMHPQTLGELRPLDLDSIAELANFSGPGGKTYRTQADLRAAIAAGNLKLDDVTDFLGRMGADRDYILRVRSAFEFSWSGFWQTAAKRFNMLPAERIFMESRVAAMAELRGMDPIDFISQVLSPGMGGDEAVLGNLGRLHEVMRGGLPVDEQQLARLVPKVDTAGEYISTPEDLIRQLGAIFAEHLDPSAKLALVKEFAPGLKARIESGELTLDMADVADMVRGDVSNSLAQSIVDGINATEGDIWEASLPVNKAEALARWPERSTEVEIRHGGRVYYVTKAVVDDSVFAEDLGAHATRAIVNTVGRLSEQFPDQPIGLVVVDDVFATIGKQASGFSIGYGDDLPSIVLDKDYFQFQYQTAERLNNGFMTRTYDYDGSLRRSNFGAPFNVSSSREAIVTHEWFHGLDLMMGQNPKKYPKYIAFRNRFYDSKARLGMGEYGMVDGREAMAELGAVAFTPGIDPLHPKFTSKFIVDPTLPNVSNKEYWLDVPYYEQYRAPGHRFTGPETLEEAVTELKAILKEEAGWKEPPVPTVNPDIIRAHRAFGEWTQKVVAQGIGNPEASPYGRILQELARIPTEGAVQYNLTEGRLVQAAFDSMAEKWRDAYRLQYFSQRRTMLERSVNHPMFGLYPASYMWGKIAPEMIRFVAQSPFGVRTGAMAYSLRDVQTSMAVQREWDPEFDQKMEALGHSQSIWFAGYLLPSVPWDIGAAFPSWMRDIAQQGLDEQARIEGGGLAEGIDLYQSAEKAGSLIDPLRSLKQVHSVGRELDEFLNPETPAQPETLPPLGTAPATGNEATIQAAELGGPLEDAVAELLAALNR